MIMLQLSLRIQSAHMVTQCRFDPQVPGHHLPAEAAILESNITFSDCRDLDHKSGDLVPVHPGVRHDARSLPKR